MATHTGSEGTIKIGANTLGELRSFSLESTAETIEKTKMGDSARSFAVGLISFTGTASVFFDETDTAQGTCDAGTSITLEVYPEGADSGDTYYSGSAIVTGRTINSSFDGMVEMELSFTGSGGLTETTV
tara:strand:+ start:130 stop:516 length:387 start_codon:yes stop_codon:yes gene_type:complete